MNVNEIITVARDYVDEPATDVSDWTDAELLRYCNLEHRFIISRYRQMYEDYLGREHIVPGSSSDRYFLPMELLTVRRVEFLNNPIAVTGTAPDYEVDEVNARIEVVEPIELNAKETSPVATSSNSAIEGHYIFGNKIVFVPGNRLTGRFIRIYYNQLSSDLHRATAQSGTANTIKLGLDGAPTTLGVISKVPNYYKDCIIEIVSGTGIGQLRYITKYNATTRFATVHEDFNPAPDSSSVYSIVSPLPHDYHELLALGAAIRAKGLKTEDDASALVQMYTALLGEMNSALESRNVSQSRRVNAI